MSSKIKVGITRDLFDEKGNFLVPGPGLNLLKGMPNLEYRVFDRFLDEVTPEQIADIDMVINQSPRWSERTLRGNDRVLAIFRMGVGYDRIDLGALHNHGVLLFITPDGVRRPMAQAILTLLLALSGKLLIKDRLTREGRWRERNQHFGMGLTGRTLGSIGVGNIGREMFVLAKPFGMRHLAYDPFADEEKLREADIRLVSLETVLEESDFLTVNCPLTEQTRHLLSGRELAKMKRTAYLINTARGPIVDEAALIQALQEGTIAGAGLDVFETEPVSPDNPLLKMDQVIVSPHALGWTDELFTGNWKQVTEQIKSLYAGKIPSGLVNPEILNTESFQEKFKSFKKRIKS